MSQPLSTDRSRRAAGLAATLLLGGLLAACDHASRSAPAPAEAPLRGRNLLLVTVDTLRADRLGAFGDTRAHTPNLDALAAGGARFAHCYAPVPLTLPSHAVMLTGRSPLATGVRINGLHYLADRETTLAERFREAGYATGAVVSAYVVVSKFGLAQGFERYDDRLAMDDVYRFYAEIPADVATARLRDWLDALPAGRPFFAWLHLYDPHQPYAPPAPWAARFPGDPYRGEVAFADAKIGELLGHLRRRGLAERTAVVVTSDHGEAFGEHGEEGHGLLVHDETLRVPLVLHAPGALPPRAIDARVSLYDLAPTLAALFGLAPLPGAGGRNLLPAMLGGETPPASEIYFESVAGAEAKGWAPVAGMLAGDLKYIRAPVPELYDLAADPGERDNVWRPRREEGEAMERRLRRYEAAATPAVAPQAERELSAEDRRQLQALGYLGRGGVAGGGGLDPKRGIRIENRVRELRTLVLAGDWRRAEAGLAALRRENPDVRFSDFYELDFQIAHARGDRDAALAALERGTRELPQVDSLALRLATYREEIGDLDGAERDARRLLARDGRLSQAHSLLGLVAEERGDTAAAAGHFAAALALEPGSVPLRAKVAELALRAGDVQRARALYDGLLAEGVLDRSPDQLARSAALDAMLGNLERAEATLRRVVMLEPAGMHRLSLALVLARRGKRTEAAAEAEAALAAEKAPLAPPQHALARELLAQLRAG